MEKYSIWPRFHAVQVKLRHMPDVRVGASMLLDTGRPIVDVRIGDGDEETLTPAEARRLAVALVRAADCCDMKTQRTPRLLRAQRRRGRRDPHCDKVKITGAALGVARASRQRE